MLQVHLSEYAIEFSDRAPLCSIFQKVQKKNRRTQIEMLDTKKLEKCLNTIGNKLQHIIFSTGKLKAGILHRSSLMQHISEIWYRNLIFPNVPAYQYPSKRHLELQQYAFRMKIQSVQKQVKQPVTDLVHGFMNHRYMGCFVPSAVLRWSLVTAVEFYLRSISYSRSSMTSIFSQTICSKTIRRNKLLQIM